VPRAGQHPPQASAPSAGGPPRSVLVTGAGLLAVAVPAGLLVAWALRRCERVVVRGRSMEPGLLPGDRLLVWKGWGSRLAVRPGDIVAARDPLQAGRRVVKRVASVGADGVVVLGDNAEASTDSRDYGPLAPSELVGRAVYRYYPPERAGRLRRMGQ